MLGMHVLASVHFMALQQGIAVTWLGNDASMYAL